MDGQRTADVLLWNPFLFFLVGHLIPIIGCPRIISRPMTLLLIVILLIRNIAIHAPTHKPQHLPQIRFQGTATEQFQERAPKLWHAPQKRRASHIAPPQGYQETTNTQYNQMTIPHNNKNPRSADSDLPFAFQSRRSCACSC